MSGGAGRMQVGPLERERECRRRRAERRMGAIASRRPGAETLLARGTPPEPPMGLPKPAKRPRGRP